MRYLKPFLVLPAAALIYMPLLVQWVAGGWPFAPLATRPSQWILAISVALPALLLALNTVRLFAHIGKGTLAPWDPPKLFVAAGPYRYVRNPMLTAVVMLVVAEAIAAASVPLLVWGLVFFAINTLYFRFIEEPELEQRFGEQYCRYKENVPRWLPKLKPYEPGEGV